MTDRKLRTVMIFGLLTSTVVTGISLFIYLVKWPGWAMATVFVIYSVIQVSLAPALYKGIYESKLLDLPKWLRIRYPPLGYRYIGEQQDDRYDVILLRSPSQVQSGPDCGEALGLGYLASVLRKRGSKVLVIDARLMGLDVMQTVELLQMYKAPMLGINLNFQYLASSTQQLIGALHRRGFDGHITLGGLYASMAYEELMAKLPQVDTIVRFEGEKTYLELLENLEQEEKWSKIEGLVYRKNDQLVVNPLRSLIPDLNMIPDPARDFLPAARDLGGYAYVLSSRGCNGACSYCVQQRSVADPTGRRWRGRDAKEVVDEVQELHEKYDIRLFSFVDDDFFGAKVDGKTHAERVAAELIRRNLDISILLSVQPRDVDPGIFALLKQAGVTSVILATDNFSQPVLDRYRKFTTVEQNLRSIKILHSLNIDAYLGIIMFDPWTTLEELTENYRLIRDLPYVRPFQILSKLEVYKGSPITEELEKQGLLQWDGYSAKYDYLDHRIQSVYRAIEVIMKLLHPSSSQFDLFRWGNLSYSEVDEWILKHFKEQLEEINRTFNRQALDLALVIVDLQSSSPAPIPPANLADQSLQREAEILNELTLRKLSNLRSEASSHKENIEADLAPAELVELEKI